MHLKSLSISSEISHDTHRVDIHGDKDTGLAVLEFHVTSVAPGCFDFFFFFLVCFLRLCRFSELVCGFHSVRLWVSCSNSPLGQHSPGGGSESLVVCSQLFRLLVPPSIHRWFWCSKSAFLCTPGRSTRKDHSTESACWGRSLPAVPLCRPRTSAGLQGAHCESSRSQLD